MIYRNVVFTFILNPYGVLKKYDTNGGMIFIEAPGHRYIQEFIKAYFLWKKKIVNFTSIKCCCNLMII